MADRSLIVRLLITARDGASATLGAVTGQLSRLAAAVTAVLGLRA